MFDEADYLETVYLNNAATSWPKPDSVYQAIDQFNRCLGANPGRGSSTGSLRAGGIILECRQALARLFNIKNEEQIAFTLNATYAINMALKGILNPGDHVIISGMEHNAVVRPLNRLQSEQRIDDFTIASCNPWGWLDPDEIRKAIRGNTRAVVVSHASNVCGTIQPIREIGAVCREYGLLFIVDAAQSAGILPIEAEVDDIHILAFTGHKALLGPQGTGGLYVRPGLPFKTLIEGGTGSFSEKMEQPDTMPDMLESGTPNTPGIAGLKAGLGYIEAAGIAALRGGEQALTEELLAGLQEIPGITVYGPRDSRQQTAVVAFNVESMDCGQLSFRLEHEYGIVSRSGLHCAPLAHISLGILQQGSCRLSIGCFNTRADIEHAVRAIYNISKTR